MGVNQVCKKTTVWQEASWTAKMTIPMSVVHVRAWFYLVYYTTYTCILFLLFK